MLALLDWPNLIAGFVLGVLGTLPFRRRDLKRAKAEAVRAAREGWAKAAKRIELATWQPTTTAGDLYVLRTQYEVDYWRSLLGPKDFKLLERLETAYQAVEREPTQERLKQQTEARLAFANMSRRMQSQSYNEIVRAEERQRIRADYRRHPLRTWKRERRSKRMRRAAGIS